MGLIFTLNKQKLQQQDDEEIAGYTRNHLHALFIFDELWCNKKKYALFTTPNNDKYVIKLGYGKKRSCVVPDEVLTYAYFKVSVFADDLLTSTTETILVSSSEYINDIDDMDDGDVFESNSTDNITSRKKNYDEDYYGRLNRFEISEHPYC